MNEEKTKVWSGFDVGKATFSAALDQMTANSKAKLTTYPAASSNGHRKVLFNSSSWLKKRLTIVNCTS